MHTLQVSSARTWREHAADLAAIEQRGGEAGALGVVQAVHVRLRMRGTCRGHLNHTSAGR